MLVKTQLKYIGYWW